MTDDTPTTSPEGRGRMKLAAVLGAAALAIPGGALISDAFAADSGSSGSGTTQQTDPGFAPVQETTPEQAPDRDRDGDGRDCPGKDGDRSGSGSSGSSSQGSADGTRAL